MHLSTGKLQVLIPTTTGPVEVLLLTEEDPAVGRSVACVGGTTETADIAAGYHAFVARPTGVIEQLFGHSCYRLDVSSRIDSGSSWQLGVLVAHALHSVGRLALEKDTPDGVVWATGAVRTVDLTVGAVSHVAEKLANSIDGLKREASAGRGVLVAIPAENAAALTEDLKADLDHHGIAVVALAHTQALWEHLALKLPEVPRATAAPPRVLPAPRRARTGRAVWVTAAAAACIALAVGAGDLLTRSRAPQTEASEQSVPPPLQKVDEALVPETIPFVSGRDRATIRSVYLTAPDFKAIALSSHTMGLTTDQSDEETARNGAMAACQRTMEEQRVRSRCELYAVGSRVVFGRGRPPMPLQPWIVRNPAAETPFAVKDVPFVSESSRKVIERSYSAGRKSKALTISATGGYSIYTIQVGVDEAVRRALERCGSNSGAACMVVAIDDSFVVPIPKSKTIVGIFQPNATNVIAPEVREDVARRLANTSGGWSAVAVGASGSVGVSVGAESEQAAIDAAMADCSTHDRACRVAVIGPFLVDMGPLENPKPADLARLAPLTDILARAVPTMSALKRAELLQKYDAFKEHKALAVVPGTNLTFRSAEWATPEAAAEGALERCQVFSGNLCAVVIIDDRPQAAAAEGTWPIRDMARARYAGTFDPDRVPGVLPRVRARSDVISYQNAPGPKAAAYHPWGRLFTVLSAENQKTAENLALSKCNADPTRQGQDGPCQLYATGNQVVLPRRLTSPLTP